MAQFDRKEKFSCGVRALQLSWGAVTANFHRMTLRMQLLVACGLLTALPVVLLGMVHARTAADSESALADRETMLASTSLARELGGLIEGHITVVRALARDIASFGQSDPDECRRRIAHYFGAFPGLYSMLVTDPKGMTIAGMLSTGADRRFTQGTSYADRAWVHEIQQGATLASELVVSRIAQRRPAVVLAVPIMNGQAELLGISVIGVDLDYVQHALQRVTEAAPGLSTVVIDSLGHVIATAGATKTMSLDDVSRVDIYRARAADGPERRFGLDETGEMRRGTVAPLTKGLRWSVTTTWPQSSVRQRAVRALTTSALFALVALALGLAAAAFLANTIALPITRVSRLIEAIRSGDLRQRSEPAQGWHARELADLVASIDRMFERLQSVVSQLRRAVVAIGEVTRQLHTASAQMVGDSYEERQAVYHGSGAIVEMTDSIGNVSTSVQGLSGAASETSASISTFGQQIDRITNNLHALGSTIDGAFVQVEQMHAQVGTVTASTNYLGANVEKTGASLRLLTDSIQRVASRAERGRSLSRETGHAAEDGRAAVEATIATTDEIEQRFAAVHRAVANLAGRSEAIGGVVHVIEEVTNATHLLSINASIIASEAGEEQGRRFRVVAERVRSMAVETAESTLRIRTLIGEVQGYIKEAVQAVQAGQETVRSGEQRSKQAGVRLRVILESSKEAEATVQEIVDATVDQAQRVQLVQEAMTEVHGAMTHIAGAVDLQRASERTVSQAFAMVRSLGDDVRKSIEAQQRESRAMSVAVRTMTNRFQIIAQAIEAQDRERNRIQGTLSVFERAAAANVDRANQIGEVVRTLRMRLEQLERELGAFRVES